MNSRRRVNSTVGPLPIFRPINIRRNGQMKVRTKSIYPTIVVLLFSMFVQVNAQQPKRSRATRNASQPAPTVSFVTGKSALKIPFELSANLILLQARVNESASLWFIFDTGADGTVIDTKLVKALRLK